MIDQWPPKPERAVPTYVVNLDDPPIERWNQIGTAYKSEVMFFLIILRNFYILVIQLFFL